MLLQLLIAKAGINMPISQTSRKPLNSFATFFALHQQACRMSLHRLCAKPLQTLNTLVVLAVAFATLALLWLLWGNFTSWQPVWQHGFAMTLYLKSDISESQSQNLVAQLNDRPDVAHVQYISPEQGLKELQNRLQLDNVLTEQQQNPLPGVIVIEPAIPSLSVKAIQNLAQKLQRIPEIATIQLNDTKIQQLAAVKAFVQRLAYLLTGLLLIGLWFVIYSTIHVMLLPHSNELSLYKSIGASNTFVRRPFLYAGVWYGLLGAVGGLILLVGLRAILVPALREVADSYQASFPLLGIDLTFTISLLVIGALLGWVCALLTTGKEWDASQHVHL
jgi:cell division transport system permease protein